MTLPAHGEVQLNGRFRRMRAKYDGFCASCNRPVASGEVIDWNPARREVHHIACTDGEARIVRDDWKSRHDYPMSWDYWRALCVENEGRDPGPCEAPGTWYDWLGYPHVPARGGR